MGAEGKYDLKLAPGFDAEAYLASVAVSSSSSALSNLKQRIKTVTSGGSSLSPAGMKVARTITTDSSSARGSVSSR